MNKRDQNSLDFESKQSRSKCSPVQSSLFLAPLPRPSPPPHRHDRRQMGCVASKSKQEVEERYKAAKSKARAASKGKKKTDKVAKKVKQRSSTGKYATR